MRLSEEQRKGLRTLILKYYPLESWKRDISVEEVLQTISTDSDFINGVNALNVRPAMDNITYELYKSNGLEYEYKKGTFYYRKAIIYKFNDEFKINKNKNILIIPNELSENNPLYFNLATGEFENKDFEWEITRISGWSNIKTVFKNYNPKYEWLFNYCENIYEISKIILSDNLSKEEKENCPKGLVNYLKENKINLIYENYKDFIYKNEYGKYYKIALKLNKRLDKNDFSKITKIVMNSFLNGCSAEYYEVKEMIELYEKAKLINENIVLDDNRDFKHNQNNFQNIIDKEKNEILAKQMQKLNFINNLEIGNYIIKVPQSQDEKIEEGRMQNNCVGSYYDNSIIAGKNLIYFIRLKNNPTKSFITCRYNRQNHGTREYRKKNNTQVKEKELIDMIKQIDEIINANNI